MFYCIALQGPTIFSVASLVVSLGLATYLILVAAARDFFPRYIILYMYLFASALLTAMGALFLWAFEITSPHYYYAFYFGKGPLVLLKYVVVCWLYWRILSSDYPSIRFSFVIVFLITVGVFLFYFALRARPMILQGDFIADASTYIERYFMTAQVLLLTILCGTIFIFNMKIDDHLKGITLGLAASFVLAFGYEALKGLVGNSSDVVRQLHPLPYLTMLAIFCCYLSSERATDPHCTERRLKAVDARLFQVLAATHLYNRYTDPIFFGFFDSKDADEFDRWKRFNKNNRKLERN